LTPKFFKAKDKLLEIHKNTTSFIFIGKNNARCVLLNPRQIKSKYISFKPKYPSPAGTGITRGSTLIGPKQGPPQETQALLTYTAFLLKTPKCLQKASLTGFHLLRLSVKVKLFYYSSSSLFYEIL